MIRFFANSQIQLIESLVRIFCKIIQLYTLDGLFFRRDRRDDKINPISLGKSPATENHTNCIERQIGFRCKRRQFVLYAPDGCSVDSLVIVPFVDVRPRCRYSLVRVSKLSHLLERIIKLLSSDEANLPGLTIVFPCG